ncbi:MAG: DEAD/DEAH box helicase family protein, partial [Bdellovibrionales bacterium]|nr:DEAD/DEAH box helicase family protein [Bdellovibrionales bacterium]
MIPIGGAQPEHNPDDSQHTGVPSPGNDQEEVKFLLPPNEIPERIINRIGQSEVVRSLFTRAILPVTRGFQLGEDCVTVFHTPEGIPEHVEIAHSHDVGGNLVSFLYRVKFIEDGRFHSPRAPNRSDWNVIEIPRDPNFLKSPRNLEELQFAFRRLFIGDPDLNPRFKESKIVQEPFQRIAVNALVSGAEARGSGMAVQPPGTGKTLVSWWTVDELFERAKSSDFLFSGKALYLVNNTVILREAREKLEQLFPGKYAITEVFDGNEDFSGEIILATPSSLANNRRIEELISSGTVHVIVHDETHHLPAETLSLLDRSLTQRMSAIGSRIHRIGVTATPARPDRLQVVGHYDDEIDFEFPITEAWRQGYAVHFKCFRGDKDINPDGISLIRPNSALDKKYRAERYGDHRFPNLASTYREVSKQDLLKKGLVLCPDVERASALANYFTAQGINAIRLAGIDRQKPNDWFEHHYFAWKNGCWPENSPYSDQAVPEIVMAVDLFNEGTDVPGITTLMIWRDTESIIRLLQGWGRGMRPSPFKNHLNLVDCVGQFRRLHVISLLVAWSSHASTAKKPRDGSSEPVEKDTLRTESERPDNNPMFEADLEEVALAFLQDVALEYVRLYGTYAQIPQRAMERLDNFIVERCGLRSSTDLRELLSKAAEALVSSRDNLSMDTSLRSQFRSTLQPAFYSLGMYQSEDGEHIPRAATTMLIYSRIYNLMLEICPELNNEDMAKLFPEFHPGLDEFLSTRASNIRFLRTHVLGLGTEALERELIAAKGPDLDETSGATNNFFTLQAEDLETRDDRIDAVRFAEGRVRVRGYAMLSPGEVVLRDLQYFQR